MSRPSPVPPWVPDGLPAAAGVYEFRDAAGHPIYVGKSVNVRRRVRGYFYGGGPDDPRLAEMLRLARSVACTRTGSDLEARLEEAGRILSERPPYNRALKRRWRGWYLEIPWRDPFPRLRVVRSTRRVGARYLGPFRGRRLPDRLRRLAEKVCRLRTCRGALRPGDDVSPCLQHGLGLCTAPCARRVRLDDYRRQVRAAARLLEEPAYAAGVRARLERRRERAAARLAFEAAAEAQRRIEWLAELEELRGVLDQGGLERSRLILLPGVRPQERVLVPVARGRVLDRRSVPWEPPGWARAVEDACYAVRVAELRADSVLPPEAMVPALIVHRWVGRGAPGGRLLDLDRLDAASAVERLRAVA